MTTIVMANKFSLSKQKEENENKNKNLMALVCGPRGVGKSSFIGTTNLPTLLITSIIEKHGAKAAKTHSISPENITEFFIDKDNDGKNLNEKESYDKLLELLDWALNSEEVKEEIKVIAFDGLSVADWIIQKLPLVIAADSYQKSKVTQGFFMNILKKLINLNEFYHIICTMPSSYTYESDGSVTSATIDLTGITTSNIVTGIFDQILPIVQIDNKHYISMEVGITKSGKSMAGANKTINYLPRITGLKKEEIHAITKGTNLLKADAASILRLIKEKEEGKLDKYFKKEGE